MKKTVAIPFVGGPFDGHEQVFSDPPIIERLALPVNDNMLPLLMGKRPGPPGPTSTIARYKLRKNSEGWQYDFVEAISADEIDLEGFRGIAEQASEDAHRKGQSDGTA